MTPKVSIAMGSKRDQTSMTTCSSSPINFTKLSFEFSDDMLGSTIVSRGMSTLSIREITFQLSHDCDI